jgi:release factor glutamine methyltransferase
VSEANGRLRTASDGPSLATPPLAASSGSIMAAAGAILASPRTDGASELTVAALVSEIERTLSGAGLDGYKIEARDVIAAVLECPRFWPSLHAREVLGDEDVEKIRRAVARRALGAPFAYAVGRSAFRYLSLHVDERVLIPRQETEQLVELVLATPQAKGGGVAADVGTGSGAIAIALASEGRFARVIATDISADSLDVARGNVAAQQGTLRATVELRCGDALRPLSGERLDVLVSNPPYIAFRELVELPSLVRDWEPAHALVCPEDGLAVARTLIEGARHVLRPGGLLALEVDSRRAAATAAIARACGDFVDVRVERDLAGRERVLLATRGDRM